MATARASWLPKWLRRPIKALHARSQEPAQAPEIDRRLEIPGWRIAGFALLAIPPLLAVAGLLGVRPMHAEATGDGVVVRVEYPGRMRLDQTERVAITVRNTGGAPAPASVRLDDEYTAAFREVLSVPSPVRAWEMRLPEIPAGGEDRAVLELRAEEPGRHRGTVSVRVGARDVEVPVSTFVFP